MCGMIDKEKKLAIAKAMFVKGDTLKKISEEMKISINVLKKLSSRENWRDERETFKRLIFEKMRELFLKQCLQQKSKAIDFLCKENDRIMFSSLSKRVSPRRNVNSILKNDKAICELLGILSPEKLYELELELKKIELEKERIALLNK